MSSRGRMGCEMGEQGKLEAAARDVARLAASEKAFWTGLWEAPIPDTLHESGVDVVRFGPIHAACVSGGAQAFRGQLHSRRQRGRGRFARPPGRCDLLARDQALCMERQLRRRLPSSRDPRPARGGRGGRLATGARTHSRRRGGEAGPRRDRAAVLPGGGYRGARLGGVGRRVRGSTRREPRLSRRQPRSSSSAYWTKRTGVAIAPSSATIRSPTSRCTSTPEWPRSHWRRGLTRVAMETGSSRYCIAAWKTRWRRAVTLSSWSTPVANRR